MAASASRAFEPLELLHGLDHLHRDELGIGEQFLQGRRHVLAFLGLDEAADEVGVDRIVKAHRRDARERGDAIRASRERLERDRRAERIADEMDALGPGPGEFVDGPALASLADLPWPGRSTHRPAAPRRASRC